MNQQKRGHRKHTTRRHTTKYKHSLTSNEPEHQHLKEPEDGKSSDNKTKIYQAKPLHLMGITHGEWTAKHGMS